MSAWIVQNGHIDVLVNALVQFDVVAKDLGADGYRSLGQKLWHENHLSVNYRYDENTATPGYQLHTTEADLDPVAVLKAIGCYDYQTCEHPGWDDSEARTLTGRLHDAILDRHPKLAQIVSGPFGAQPRYCNLSEYDRAPWGFDLLEQAVKVTVHA